MMERKYLQDLIVTLAVILLIVIALKDYGQYRTARGIPGESRYKSIALGEQLLRQIRNIEESIQNRKQFVFTVTKDPLEQNLIVKTKKDLEKQWKKKVEDMIRLESTIVHESGARAATISHKGSTVLYRIGDAFLDGRIVAIEQGEVRYVSRGESHVLILQKIPPRPAEIRDREFSKDREYNW